MKSKLILAALSSLALLSGVACSTTTAHTRDSASGMSTSKDKTDSAEYLNRNGYRNEEPRTGMRWSDPTKPTTEELLKQSN